MRTEEPQRVKVAYVGLVRNVLGRSEEEAQVSNGATVGGLLEELSARHGDPFRASVFKGNGDLRSTVLICVDDCDVAQLAGLDTPLQTGAEVTVVVGVYPPEGG